MSNYVLLNPEQYQNAGWVPVSHFEHARKFQFVSVALDELAQLLSIYPLGFFCKKGGAEPRFVAVTGLQQGENLFVAHTGRWLAPYVPRTLRLHPFKMTSTEAGSNNHSVGFDLDSGCLRETLDSEQAALPFFNQEQQPTEALSEVMRLLQQELNGRRLTHRALAGLEKHQLLMPWPQEGTLKSPDEGGLYVIDEKALNSCDGDAIKELQRSGALALAYAQLFSMQRMQFLKQLMDMHAAHKKKIDQQQEQQGLTGVFTPEHDGFSFDFE